MESTNTTRAPSVRAWCSIASSRVSPSTWTAPASTVNRSARSRIWSGDSSPDTYSAGTPACSSRAAHCSRSVDFPIPGSPPTSTTDPGTIPPPPFGCSAPHSVQRNTERGPPLATAGLGGRFPRRVIVEPRVLLLEEQLHGARGAVALLADDQLGESLDALVGLRVHGTVVEL